MTPADERAREIAGRLTKAQRAMIDRVGSGRCFERYCDMRTLHALDARKLTGAFVEQDTFEAMVTLTDIGKKVAAALREMQGETK